MGGGFFRSASKDDDSSDCDESDEAQPCHAPAQPQAHSAELQKPELVVGEENRRKGSDELFANESSSSHTATAVSKMKADAPAATTMMMAVGKKKQANTQEQTEMTAATAENGNEEGVSRVELH